MTHDKLAVWSGILGFVMLFMGSGSGFLESKNPRAQRIRSMIYLSIGFAGVFAFVMMSWN